MKKSVSLSLIFTASLVLFSCVSTEETQEPLPESTDVSSVQSEKPVPKKQEPAVIAIHNKEPEGEIYTLESFEDGNFWYGNGEEHPESNSAVQASLSEAWCSQGESSGNWKFNSTSSKKHATFQTDAPLFTDWTDCRYLVADIYNRTNSSLSIKLLVNTGSNGFTETYEIQTVNIGKGLNTNVIFDLVNGIRYKGQEVAGIGGYDSVCSLCFEITNDTKGGELYIDSIRLIK